ncbi:hypothetical protein [Hymenobacter cellulosivorans]|uniref:Outer membrane protein beta-barrel domain-containing protein n=1 Tax=Hymenobacter cellulosivorans TaxID=2932249 RepID=A0ABY4F4J7_9BACT|nr:hypothetical protein [Hymenobacter cellulosivorans]UOQ51480.1 hypothetical protein MUN80_17135 [Hymenobacter cellulosivorans]
MTTYRFVLLIGLLLGWAGRAQAQRILLRENPAEDTVASVFGPNRAYYNHFYLGYGLVAGPGSARPGAELRYGNSAEIVVGLRNKFRMSQTLALGLDMRYARVTYYLAQNAQKVVPNSAQHYREYLALPQAQLEGFVRLNYGPRGNVIGRYVDVSGWGGWVISTAHHYEDRPGAGAKRVTVTEHGLNYLRRWSYGAGLRAGSSRYALTARYRFSDVFTAATQPQYPELPRWVIGLELGWL